MFNNINSICATRACLKHLQLKNMKWIGQLILQFKPYFLTRKQNFRCSDIDMQSGSEYYTDVKQLKSDKTKINIHADKFRKKNC